jgi:hypothetical protein
MRLFLLEGLAKELCIIRLFLYFTVGLMVASWSYCCKAYNLGLVFQVKHVLMYSTLWIKSLCASIDAHVGAPFPLWKKIINLIQRKRTHEKWRNLPFLFGFREKTKEFYYPLKPFFYTQGHKEQGKGHKISYKWLNLRARLLYGILKGILEDSNP